MNEPVVLKVAYFHREGYGGETHVYTSVLAKVKNIDYIKDVRVHYSSGGIWKDGSLGWLANYGNYDVFSGVTGLTDLGSMEFALSYTCDGVTYWDNNNWKNYRIDGEWQPEMGHNVLLNHAEYVMGGTAGACYVTGISGSILVRNQSYHKHVGIRYSPDKYTWHDIPATYRHSLGPVEIWTFGFSSSPAA